MRATIVVLLCLSACCIGGSFAQCDRHTQSCVENTVNSLLFVVRNNIARIELEDERFKFLFIDITFSNIQIASFTLGRVTARDTGSQIAVTVNDIAFRITANWRRKRLFRTRRGTIEASASDSSFTLTYDKSATCPRGEAFRCDDDLNNYNFRIRGRRFGLIPTRRAPGEFKKVIVEKFCDAMRQFLTAVLPLVRRC